VPSARFALSPVVRGIASVADFHRSFFVLSSDAPHVALAISVDDLEQSTARCGEVLFRRRGHPEQKAG
jgi:hypothetical protein